jgi:4-hydroxyphenylpyruvate dioxygenase
MDIDHVHFYVEDAQAWGNWLRHTLNFDVVGQRQTPDTHTEFLQHGSVRLRVSSPLAASSPVSQFLQQHPAGVADVGFRVQDLEQTLSQAQAAGAKVLQPIHLAADPEGGLPLPWAQISGWGGLRHTLVQHPLSTASQVGDFAEIAFTEIDHIVLNVPREAFDAALNWYEATLGFQRDRPFEITTPHSGLKSQVLVHPQGSAQLPINAPTSPNSQIQEFLDWNRGAGIQHMALRTDHLISVTQKLKQQGLTFLNTPQSYYHTLATLLAQTEHPSLSAAEITQLQAYGILADWQVQPAHSLLLQIFSQPIFGQPTFFLEFIERRHRAQGFGEGNFLALFEAIEREQQQRQKV